MLQPNMQVSHKKRPAPWSPLNYALMIDECHEPLALVAIETSGEWRREGVPRTLHRAIDINPTLILRSSITLPLPLVPPHVRPGLPCQHLPDYAKILRVTRLGSNSFRQASMSAQRFLASITSQPLKCLSFSHVGWLSCSFRASWPIVDQSGANHQGRQGRNVVFSCRAIATMPGRSDFQNALKPPLLPSEDLHEDPVFDPVLSLSFFPFLIEARQMYHARAVDILWALRIFCMLGH